MGRSHDESSRAGSAQWPYHALERYIRMVRLAPGQPEPELREALRKLVNAQVKLDRPAEALPHAEELVRIWRSSAAANPAGDKAYLYQTDLAFALEGVSTCRRFAGLDARDSAVESVAILCQLVTSATNKHARHEHAPALAHALGTLDAALGTQHNTEALEIGRWVKDHKDDNFAEWIKNVGKSLECDAKLFELSMRSLIEAGHLEEARSAGAEAVSLYRLRARADPQYEATVARMLRDLGRAG